MSLQALSDDLLVHIFDCLGGEARVHGPETFKAVPLVCRRWHGLSQAPQLRRRLLIRLTTLALCEVPGCLARLRSLRAWVLHAPGHVRSLRLTAGPLDILSAAERREAEALLAAILASCGGSLRHLHLSVGPAADFSGWLPLAPQLRSVKLHNLLGPGIGAKPPSRLTAPWGGASLEHLALSDVVVAASPNGLLPPSLTSLELAVMQNFLAQADCSRLTRLRQLSIASSSPAADQYEALASLPALERLALTCCQHLPACLGQLPALRLLAIRYSPTWQPGAPDEYDDEPAPDTRGARLSEALNAPQLARLTQLELCLDYTLEQWPPALLTLTNLQGLHLDVTYDSPPLPAGPWLGNLRWAVLSAHIAGSASLAGASRLERLALTSPAPLDWIRTQLLEVLAWVHGQPAMRLLEIDHRYPEPDESARAHQDPAVCAAIEQARVAAPALRVQFGSRLQQQLCFPLNPPDVMSYD